MPRGIFADAKDKKCVVSLYNAGYSVKEINDFCGYAIPTIYHWLRKHNVVLRSTPHWGKYRKVVSQRNAATFQLARQTGAL